jgi:hypothetical protein
MYMYMADRGICIGYGPPRTNGAGSRVVGAGTAICTGPPMPLVSCCVPSREKTIADPHRHNQQRKRHVHLRRCMHSLHLFLKSPA